MTKKKAVLANMQKLRLEVKSIEKQENLFS